jgi:hypothetical protein
MERPIALIRLPQGMYVVKKAVKNIVFRIVG